MLNWISCFPTQNIPVLNNKQCLKGFGHIFFEICNIIQCITPLTLEDVENINNKLSYIDVGFYVESGH